jgi:hypothetical protein
LQDQLGFLTFIIGGDAESEWQFLASRPEPHRLPKDQVFVFIVLTFSLMGGQLLPRINWHNSECKTCCPAMFPM